MGLYQSLPDELGLLPLEERLLALGARLFSPRITAQGVKELEFVEIASCQPGGERGFESWKPGPYGIREPHPRLPAAPSGLLDLVVVPGVAFGLSGERIGMGAGYYDRFLARVPQVLRIVLAFDFQLLDSLELNPWDQPVDWIITESREVKGARLAPWIAGRLQG